MIGPAAAGDSSSAMLNLLRSLLLVGLPFVRTRRQLAVEIFALRHRLGILKRSVIHSAEEILPPLVSSSCRLP